MARIGLISDTHGLLRPEAKAFLEGCDHIVHGGDIGNAVILQELERIAPVTAVRGNNDWEPWARGLSATAHLTFGDVRVFAIHDLAEMDVDPRKDGIHVVVSGHSHVPRITHGDGVVYVNPGSAGPRRFTLPIAAGELIIDGSTVTPRIVHLL